jgi:hypothetical protein
MGAMPLIAQIYRVVHMVVEQILLILLILLT